MQKKMAGAARALRMPRAASRWEFDHPEMVQCEYWTHQGNLNQM